MWTMTTPEIADSYLSLVFELCPCLGPHWKAWLAWNAGR